MNSTKILVVDDEPDVELLIRQKFAKQIKAKEIEFVFVSNGAEALKALYQDHEIHIILTDINMPEMDGLMLLSHLPDLQRIFKAVIISAYGDMSNIRKAMNRGASDFITKPIDFKDLEITILNAIEQCTTLQKAMEAQETLSTLERELAIANHIQQAIIPHHFNPFPRVHSFEIYGTMIPAAQVGGDFFDFFALDEDRLGFIIADVSGKGIPASIFMAMSRAIIRGTAFKATSPKECFAEANYLLCMDNEACMFVTAFYGVYHISSGLIECVNAGHNPPILLQADGTQTKITPNQGIPLGIMANDNYRNYQLTLHAGDCLILYTDGIVEARNAQQNDYGEKRFSQSISNWTPGPLPTLTTHLLDQLAQFTQGTRPFDDVALFCIKRLE
jgi:sigma-B regulation protein RsbU (phosphoserine phosphatase)